MDMDMKGIHYVTDASRIFLRALISQHCCGGHSMEF